MSAPRTIVGLGEVLWDVFPDGARFGGAPANFACIAAQLAGERASVCVASRVGHDELGRRALAALSAHGVDTRSVGQDERPTGQVLVQLDGAGHASYTFAADTAWDNLVWSNELAELARRSDVVCFGTLGQRSAASKDTIQRFVRETPAAALRVFDINLRPPYWTPKVVFDSLELAGVLKLNDAELPILRDLLSLHGSDREVLHELCDRFSLGVVALTRGAAGSLLLNGAGECSDLSGSPVNVVDTVGAGDAFTAALVVGLLDGLPLGTIHQWAARVAAFVCTQPGATPRIPDSLRRP
jgi:fructokinase